MFPWFFSLSGFWVFSHCCLHGQKGEYLNLVQELLGLKSAGFEKVLYILSCVGVKYGLGPAVHFKPMHHSTRSILSPDLIWSLNCVIRPENKGSSCQPVLQSNFVFYEDRWGANVITGHVSEKEWKQWLQMTPSPWITILLKSRACLDSLSNHLNHFPFFSSFSLAPPQIVISFFGVIIGLVG